MQIVTIEGDYCSPNQCISKQKGYTLLNNSWFKGKIKTETINHLCINRSESSTNQHLLTMANAALRGNFIDSIPLSFIIKE